MREEGNEGKFLSEKIGRERKGRFFGERGEREGRRKDLGEGFSRESGMRWWVD